MFSAFFSENFIVNEICGKISQILAVHMTIWHMRIACCILKSTNTNSEYVIHIAFILQHWLRENASVLRYTYTACLVTICME